jgi:hypothetical protein
MYSTVQTPFQIHFLSENLVASGIEHGSLDLLTGTDHKTAESY